jgi:acetolactate synthase-1/2/3 large subunit
MTQTIPGSTVARTDKPATPAVVTAGPGTSDAITGLANAFRAEGPMLLIGGKAFRECYNGDPGPSFLEIPRDVLDAKVPLERARLPRTGGYRASTRSAGDPAAIETLADQLTHAEKACVLLGNHDLNYGTVGKNRDVDLGIVGDAGAVLSSVAQATSGRDPDVYARGTMNQTMYK